MARKTPPTQHRRQAPQALPRAGTLSHLAGGRAVPAATPAPDPAEARRLTAEGQRHLAQGDARAAEQAFRKLPLRAIRLIPALSGLGMIAAQAGALPNAARMFLAASKSEPKVSSSTCPERRDGAWQMGRHADGPGRCLNRRHGGLRGRPGSSWPMARRCWKPVMPRCGAGGPGCQEGQVTRMDRRRLRFSAGRCCGRAGRTRPSVEMRAASEARDASAWVLNDWGQALAATGEREAAVGCVPAGSPPGVERAGGLEVGVTRGNPGLAASASGMRRKRFWRT